MRQVRTGWSKLEQDEASQNGVGGSWNGFDTGQV